MDRRILCFLSLFIAINAQMIYPDDPILQKNYLQRVESEWYSQHALRSNIYSDGATQSLKRAINKFALNINKEFLNSFKESQEDNVVLSPMSILGALALLTLGSVGKTHNELAQTLGIFGNLRSTQSSHEAFASILNQIVEKQNYRQSTNQSIDYGSSLFIQKNYKIRQEYRRAVDNIYKSEIQSVDFENNIVEAQNVINKWVSDLTHGKIENILSRLPSSETRLIIGSALYFSAEWERYFLDGLTKKLNFTVSPDTNLLVDMMANEGQFLFHRSLEHECMILGLPYKGNKTTLYAIKPLDANKKSLRQIINDLTPETLEHLIKSGQKQSTIVLFPRMKLTTGYSLKNVLQKMGIQSVFSPIDSNLALISTSRDSSQDESEEDRLIFTRFASEESDEDCREIFNANNTSINNCTTTETIRGRKVRVIYKKIDDKIGRMIVKREVKRTKRQSYNLWNPGLYVDDVIHKVNMLITETGTEAAAATMVLISRDGRRPVFRANEPFFFIIRDEETSVPLFTSIIYRPTPNYT